MAYGNWCAGCGAAEPEDLVQQWPLAPGGHGGQTVQLCFRCMAQADRFRGDVEEAKKLASFGVTHTLLQEKTADEIIDEVGPVVGGLMFQTSSEIARILNQRGYTLPRGQKWDKNTAAAVAIAYRNKLAGPGGKTYDADHDCECDECVAARA